MSEGVSKIKLTDRPVELRVHGVGGAMPSEVLGVDSVTLADSNSPNDGTTGFYVPIEDADRYLQGPDRQLESYSWGGLTRASASRAAWLILAPFALTNLAGWMIEHDGDATQAERDLTFSDSLNRILARLIALTMTTSAVFLACRVAFDVLIIQCGAVDACHDRWWAWPIGRFSGHAGRQLLVGSILPLGLLAAVAFITRRSQLASTPGAIAKLEADPTFADSWKDPEFWSKFGVSHRLGISHLAAGLAVTGLMLAGTAEQIARAPETVMVAAGLALLGATAFGINFLRLPVVAYWTLLGVSIGYLLAAMFQLATLQDGAFLPGAAAGPVFSVINTTSQVVLIALLALTTWRGRSRRPIRAGARSERLYRWAMPPALMVAAAGLIAAFGAGTEILVRNIAETPATGPLSVAPTAGIVASAYLIALVTLLVAGLSLYLRGLRNGPALDDVADEYEGFVDRPHLERIRRAKALARLTDEVPGILIAATITLVAVVLVVFAQVAVTGEGLSDPDLQNPFQWLENIASAVLLTLPLTGGILLWGSYQSSSIRRVVGILWDICTFWPRRFHPFAPPSYGERTVPDLKQRLQFHQERGVMLSGHSQGSVLALAALADETSDLSLVAVLTYGSPIERLYARYFPEYVSDELVTETVEQMEGRWVNLYRDTDFIGGPIEAVEVNVRMRDPDEADGPVRSHFGYENTHDYREALRRLI